MGLGVCSMMFLSTGSAEKSWSFSFFIGCEFGGSNGFVGRWLLSALNVEGCDTRDDDGCTVAGEPK